MSASTTNTFPTSYQRFQFYCLWKLPDTMKEYLDTYRTLRIPADKLRDIVQLEDAARQKNLMLLHDNVPYPVAWHAASPYQLLRDSQSTKRNPAEPIYYWISLRSCGRDKVALVTVDHFTIPPQNPGELARHTY